MTLMGRHLLLCTTLLLGCFAGGRSETQYVLSIPASLPSGESAKACVNIMGSDEKLDVILVLNHNGKNTSIISEDVPTFPYFQCADFQVPKVPEAVPVAVIFSALGQKTDIRERKTVVANPTRTSCQFQMDKPIYKPGQKVMCRVICLDSQLKAINEKFSIYLQDPSRAKIAHWVNKESEHGILSLEFQLIPDAVPGSYSFTIERDSGTTLNQWFTVEEYVKPRFSVKMDAPNTISVLDESFKFKVSAIYTFGESVAGVVTVIYCKEPSFYGRRKNCFRERGNRCSNITGELGPDGIFNGEIDLYDSFMGSSGSSLRLDIIVTETGTGIQTKESHYVWVTSQPARISFDYEMITPNYKRGLDYPVVGKVTDEQDRPIANQDVEIEIDGSLIATVKTDDEGKIDYRIDTHDMVAENFTVKISYKNPDQCYYAEWREADYPTAEYTVYRFYSTSGSFLQAKRPKGEVACGQDYRVEVNYIINPSGVEEGATKVTLYNLVLSRSKIVHSGQQDIDLTGSMNGSLSVIIPVSADMAPNANLVMYMLMKKELVAETAELNIETCFKNQVSMTFGQEKGTPGTDAEVLISGEPESICGIRVVDASLFLLNSYESFSANSIYNSIRTWFFGYNVAGFDVEDPAPPCEDPDKLVFFNGRYYLPRSSSSERDSYQQLRDVGLVFATDLQSRKPEVCDKNPPGQSKHPIVPMALEGGLGSSVSFKANADGAGRGGGGSIETVRTNFSETFIWTIVPLDGEGHARLTEKAPDSITQWQGSAFCISDRVGFGMTRYPANYTTFLPFFIELSMPFSMIRGETLMLVAVVSNFMEMCFKVEVTLEPSDAFTAELKEGTQEACVCSNGRASVTWAVQAKHLGVIAFTASAQTTFISATCDGSNDDSQPSRKDTVVQTMIVEPEGIKQERTLSDLVLVKNTKSVLPVSITPPNSAVPDSISASVSAFGDIFGLPLGSLQDLVQKPYGCGEQNLGRMAPIPFVIEYLNNTGQLKDEILEKAKRYMTEGYYRQLGFWTVGGYRTFPNYQEQANSWLTAYTFGVLEKCKKLIYIDPTRQQQTLLTLENTQRLDNGCFKPQGRMYMAEDVDEALHFTAYVATMLLQSEYSLGMTLLDGAMECLKNASTTDQKIATEAMMVYAFTLAGLPEYRDPLLQKLLKKAIIEGGTMHWQRENMPKERPVPLFLPTFPPAEVKMTSFILLALTALPTRSEEHMTYIAQSSLWLTRQMNSRGGFGSTSDTAVALQAIAAVAELLFTPNSQQTVLVRRGNAEIANFDLNQENRLVMHRQTLPEANGDYSVEVEGVGWCLIQNTVTYYIPIPQENSAFNLALSSTSDKCLNGIAQTFNISGTVSYQGYRNASNMAIVNIRMLSGYSPDYWSLQELKEKNIISRHEDNRRGDLLLYFSTVTGEPIEFTVRVFMGPRMLNIKSSSAMVYDYYDPDENGYATYSHPCTERSA